MKPAQLVKLGVPKPLLGLAIECIRGAAASGLKSYEELKNQIDVAIIPELPAYTLSIHFTPLWKANCEYLLNKPVRRTEPVPYRVWGAAPSDVIAQMDNVCMASSAVGGALMPDNQLGYHIPVGGVVAFDEHLCPMGVGVDIGCSVGISILDLPPDFDRLHVSNYLAALQVCTKFGFEQFHTMLNHPIMDAAQWQMLPMLKQLKDLAWRQLGTSGGGNHFVDIGEIELYAPTRLPANIQSEITQINPVGQGKYLCVVSHSGSRGVGYKVARHYSDIAKEYGEDLVLPLNNSMANHVGTCAGDEYWLAMNFMGDYTRACHSLIHEGIANYLGAAVLGAAFNTHNLAFKEEHGGKALFVHRKGATPAWSGQLGIIPGSMGTPGYLVRGLGNSASLMSASHGAGRNMSRANAFKTLDMNFWQQELEKRGVTLMGGALDEMPGAYKDIDEVMGQQADLVRPIGRFFPRVVRMDAERHDSWRE